MCNLLYDQQAADDWLMGKSSKFNLRNLINSRPPNDDVIALMFLKQHMNWLVVEDEEGNPIFTRSIPPDELQGELSFWYKEIYRDYDNRRCHDDYQLDAVLSAMRRYCITCPRSMDEIYRGIACNLQVKPEYIALFRIPDYE